MITEMLQQARVIHKCYQSKQGKGFPNLKQNSELCLRHIEVQSFLSK